MPRTRFAIRRLTRACLLSFSLLTSAFLLPAHAQQVDNTTIQGKVLAGYQGWFRCPGDGSSWNYWGHWSANNAPPSADTVSVEDFPDLSGMDASSLCPASGLIVDGKPTNLFTSFAPATEETHFRWMKEYGIDGVFVARFLGAVPGDAPDHEQVLRNIMAAAEDNGRIFAIDYDLTGVHAALSDDDFMAFLENDWNHLVNDIGVTKSPSYAHEGGRPVLGLWGIGMNSDTYVDDPALAQRIITWAHDVAHVTIKGGVSTGWTTPGQYGSMGGQGWEAIYAQLDIISPWSVGKFNDLSGIDSFRHTLMEPEMARAKANGQIYMPVISPGFSDHNNDRNSPENATPRLGGRFLWNQAYNARDIGANTVEIAMFDEINESTAIMKVASHRSQAPAGGYWLTLDADGYDLPSDWYLRLGYEITRTFRGSTPNSKEMPTQPWIGSASACSVLLPQQSLSVQQSVKSCDERYELILQSDGNLVLYKAGTALWASGTAGTPTAAVIMQGDGNLVAYDAGGKALWASHTEGHDGALLRLTDDGELIVADATGTVRKIN